MNDVQRRRVLDLNGEGYSLGKIKELMWKEYQISLSREAVRLCVKKATCSRKTGSGRPKVTNAKMDRRIVNLARGNNRATLNEIRIAT